MSEAERIKVKDAIVALAQVIAKQPLPPLPKKEPSIADHAHLLPPTKWGMQEDMDEFLRDGDTERRALPGVMKDHPMTLLGELQIEGRIPPEIYADDRRFFALLNKIGA